MNPNEMNGMIFASGWVNNSMMDDGESSSLSRYSSDQEPRNDFVLESWLSEQDSSNSSLLDDDADFMMMDVGFDESEEIPHTPPAGRLLLEEALEDTLAAAASQQGDDDDDSFFTTHSHIELSPASPSANLTSFLPLEQRYEATLEKLSESMRKSQETRKSLRIQTSENMEYNRWNSISGTLTSIEKSTQQLQQYLKNKKPTQVL